MEYKGAIIARKIEYWEGYIVFFVVFSVILFISQIYVQWISMTDVGLKNLFILFKEDVNIVNFILNNFLNQNLMHLIFNLIIMWIGLTLLFFTTRMGKKLLLFHMVIIFLLAPLILSLVNIEMMRTLSIHSLIGYSGIASVFLGYGFYSLSEFIYEERFNLKIPFIKNNIKTLIVFLLILPLLIFIFLADPLEIQFLLNYGLIQGILNTITISGTNIVAHVLGYIMGLAIPFIFNPIVSLFIQQDGELL